MALRTLITAKLVIAYRDGGHVLLPEGQVVFEGDTIAWVGRGDPGPVDTRIDASHQLLCPGFVSLHAHLTNSPLTKSFLEDRGNPFHYMSGLYEALTLTEVGPDDALAAARFSLVELLTSGVTTVVEVGGPAAEAVADLAGRVGIRAYVVPGFRSGRWHSPDGRRVHYEWDEGAGERGLARNVEFVRTHRHAHDGRVRSLLGPAQIDTCTPALLRATARAAAELDVPVTIHAAQAVIEFQEITRRHGRTPVELLADVGLLGPRLIIGHCLFTSHHPQVHFPGGRDLELLARSGASVAHCPWVFGRRGVVMHSYGRYLAAGITVGLGTDTVPQDMLHEMRWAAVLSKVADGDPRTATARDVFNSATLAGARALGRDDLGRIAPGAKADLLLFDLDTLGMAPMRDPVRNLVYGATRRDLDAVFVDGRPVVRRGRVGEMDERGLARAVQAGAERMWAAMPARDPAGRTVDQISEPSFPTWAPDGRRGA